MSKTILLKGVVTEKSDLLMKKNQYVFRVAKDSNKIEIRKAVESQYDVQVLAVNTAVLPGKIKNRSTKSGIIKGRKPAYKKAIVTLAEGDSISFVSEATEE